jgi:hypothetical protein
MTSVVYDCKDVGTSHSIRGDATQILLYTVSSVEFHVCIYFRASRSMLRDVLGCKSNVLGMYHNVTTTFFALTPALALSIAPCKASSPVPATSGSGFATNLFSSSALGKNSL